MDQKRLFGDEVDFVMKMSKLGYSNCEIARKLGVSEGAIRYRLKREKSGKADGRKNKPSQLDKYMSVISRWVDKYKDKRQRPVLKVLYERLRDFHGYKKSYDAVRRYMRKNYPEFVKKNAKLRIETPPGELIQVDWKEDVYVEMVEAGNYVKLHALILTMCFSRKVVIIFMDKKDIDAFLHGHQEAFRRFGGLAMVIRPDCLKTAILKWRGSNSKLNEKYKKYITRLGMEVFPGRPGRPTDKGKVEKRIRDIFSRLDIWHKVYKDITDIQEYVDAKLKELEQEWRCGATGLSVAQSFAYEKKFLKPLPEIFLQLPIEEKYTRVRNDGTVYFLENYYQVEGKYIGKQVLCLHTGREIVIFRDGREIGRFPYLPGTRGMVMLSQKALTDSKLFISQQVRDWALEVARRQISIYHEITQGGIN